MKNLKESVFELSTKYEFESLDENKSKALVFFRRFGYVIIENVLKKNIVMR